MRGHADRCDPAGGSDGTHPGAVPHTLALGFDGPARTGAQVSYAQRLRARSDVDICCDFVDHVRSRPADEAEHALLQEGIAAVQIDRARADDEGIAAIGGEAREGVA